MAIFVIATLDTKGQEAAFVCKRLRAHGAAVRLVDCGCLGEPTVTPDLSRELVYQTAGRTLQEVQAAGDRGQAVALAAEGVSRLMQEAYADGELTGIFGLGGSAGTTIGTAAMQVLPFAVPKVMVSTLASGQVRQYVGQKNILMMNSVVDLAGINRVSRIVLWQAAAAMAGMSGAGMVRVADSADESKDDRPLVAATMFGVTTPCVEAARQRLQEAGYEVLVFHATGTGGQVMETLIQDGLISGVFDVTTTELADELVGGILSAGPDRLTAAGRQGVPQVISVGALDMVNFGPPETVPDRFRDRRFYQHNPHVTLMRTTPEENQQLGALIAQKVKSATGPTKVIFPLAGVSAIDRQEQPFDDPAARTALLMALREGLQPGQLVERPEHINDPKFAEVLADILLSLMAQSQVEKTDPS